MFVFVVLCRWSLIHFQPQADVLHLCETLVQQAHFEFKYELQRAEHGDPRLTKILYKKFQGIVTETGTETRVGTSIVASGDPTRFERSAILGESSSSSSSRAVNIKLEGGEPFEKFKVDVMALKASKVILEKRFIEGQDLAETLAQDPSLASKCAELKTAMTSLGAFIDTTRSHIAATDRIQPSDSTLTTMIEKMAPLQELATAHSDGSKMLLKRMKALVS